MRLAVCALLFVLAASPCAAAPAAPALPQPAAAGRLAIEGLAPGDPESRLVTLMPTARCSDVEGDAGLADRWCRMPDQLVLGVLPQSLSASLRQDRVDAVLARFPARAWALLRARLEQAHGAPDERVAAVLPDAMVAHQEAPEGLDTLRWQRGGVLLVLEADAGGRPVLGLRRATDIVR